MKADKTRSFSRLTDKLYGGLKMSWLTVILFAVGTAVLTAVFLIVPVFRGTSFERMGVYLEAWIFFAVIIMANCKKPLESALKTFVFFLISQPLIYLLQVPFSYMGWGLFGYYKNFFIRTLLTFPMAFVGWYIKKKNWLSVLIFSPVLVFLGSVIPEFVRNFPHFILTAVFCLFQVFLYVYVFFPKIGQKVVGILITGITVITLIAFTLITPKSFLTIQDTLPDEPALSSEATVTVEDSEIAAVSFVNPEYARVNIEAHKYGTTAVIVKDGDKELRYIIEVYEDNGTNQIKITPSA